MKIFVFGNINAGKSFLIKKLALVFYDYKIFQIDEYRKQIGDGSIEKENLIQNKFIFDLLKEDNAIIEFSGLGCIADKIISKLNNNSCIILIMNENVFTCLDRLNFKKFEDIPYPKFQNMESLNETIIRLYKEIASKQIEKLWYKKALKIYQVFANNDINSLPLKHYHTLFLWIERFKKLNIKAIISFGSCGRGSINENSDIDLFIITDKVINNLIDELNIQCKYLIVDSKLIIYDTVILEIIVTDDIRKFSKYYKMSNIPEIDKTILFSTINIKQALYKIYNEPIDFMSEKERMISKLKYYYFSLAYLIQKNDEYKYYFHNNIMIHELIKLYTINSGCKEFLYLPLQAKNYISNTEWNILHYNIGDDMKHHYKNIQQILQRYI